MFIDHEYFTRAKDNFQALGLRLTTLQRQSKEGTLPSEKLNEMYALEGFIEKFYKEIQKINFATRY